MYEFKEDDAYRFAQKLGIKTYRQGDNLHFKWCPYCKGGAKDPKTFAINLKNGAFHCLRASCGASGNMITLSKDFDFPLGNMVDEYYRPTKEYKQLKTPKEPIEPKPEAISYLESRGISEEVAKRYEITTHKKHSNILVLPFFDESGKLQLIKYRKMDFDKEKDKNKEWCESECKPILFGMKQCKNFDRLIITEGQIDQLSVATAGIDNAVSVPTGAKGFTWLPYCWNWINKFKEVIVFGDYEKGKISLLDELSKRLKVSVKHVREEDYKDCKDANEILQKYGVEQIKNCIENAQAIPMKQIVDLADVENVDINNIEKVKTGIDLIDKLLYGGLPMGGVVLVSAKNGAGKSTLTSQMILNAIDQGYKCFIYSGEMPNYQIKNWIDFQAAGPHHINEYENGGGIKYYQVSKINRETISNWYRGKCFLYDSSAIYGDEKDSLVTIVENMIMQYGIRVILLDNLMTAIDLESGSNNDKYEKQSLFVKKLARIALKYNVLITLVAHKRKNNFSENENDEISGSGDITNLATVTISYDRAKDLLPSQRICKVSKNRLFGRVETKGWVLEYDERSKRIYGKGDDLYKEYSWNKPINGFYEIELGETPFV